jgi:hypothetical protein
MENTGMRLKGREEERSEGAGGRSTSSVAPAMAVRTEMLD